MGQLLYFTGRGAGKISCQLEFMCNLGKTGKKCLMIVGSTAKAQQVREQFAHLLNEFVLVKSPEELQVERDGEFSMVIIRESCP